MEGCLGIGLKELTRQEISRMVFIGFWPFQDGFFSGTLELPDFIDWAILGGSKRSNLLPWDRLSFAISGSAPKFSKKTILAGLI